MTSWRTIGEKIYVRRHASYDLNVGLIVGDDACLVIDTRETTAAGNDLARAVRDVTGLPWLVVNTHAHFDHTLGNAAFADEHVEIWAHERCREHLRDYSDIHAHLAQIDVPTLSLPNRLMSSRASLDVGGRTVDLHHFGPGHTDHDVIAHVPDADIVFAGDLVENGAPPSFGDSFPLDWPAALGGMLALEPRRVVPGHGDLVDALFVRQQRDDIAAVADRARHAYGDGRTARDAAAPGGPFPVEVLTEAIERAYRQLRGDLPYDSPAQVRAALGLPSR